MPALARATVVAGAETLESRFVQWMAVTEYPVDGFVAPGEFVLTTGLGCSVETFVRMVQDVAEAGAAALLVGVGEGAPMHAVPPEARAVADDYGLPLVELPWEVRFADVLRGLTDHLLAARYATTLDSGAHLPSDFTTALLHRDGLRSIAQALEGIVARPVVILDSEFQAIAQGPLAATKLEDTDIRTATTATADDRPAERLSAIRTRLADGEVHRIDDGWEASLPAGIVVASRARGSTLGYVLVCDAGDGAEPQEPLIVERHAMSHAAIAAAIETLRRQAVADAEANARGDFLWELASRALANHAEIRTKAVLLGYDTNQAYRVVVAEAEDSLKDGEDALDELIRQIHRHGAPVGAQASRRGTRLLLVVPTSAPVALQPAALIDRVRSGSTEVSWGIADGDFTLPELAEGVDRAGRTLRVGRALEGPGVLADAARLGPFLLLHAVADDETARQSAAAVIAPLVEYDRDTARGLVQTLEIFLAENGNTSSAARQLFLNRHSLIYRLRKIESLTGRSLDNHDDRFLFELSLRLHRLSG